VDVLSSVSKSGSKSVSRLQSLAYASWLKNWALGSEVCIYTYPVGTPSIADGWAASLLPGGTSGVSCGCVVGSGVGCLSHSGGGAPVPLHLQCLWGFCAVPCWQGRQPSVWISWSIAGCHSIPAFTFLCPGNPTPHFFRSRTSARGFLNRKCVSSIAARENSPLAILAISKARHMSDCSSCTRPPCRAIVADMLKTYKEISCCIYIIDSAIALTIYASVASSNVVKACLVHSREFISLNSSAKIPELTTSWCSISRTVQTNSLVDHGGYPLLVARNWSLSSLRRPAACYIISWRSSTLIRLYSHLIVCWFLLLLLPVIQKVFDCWSWVMFSVAAFAESRWAKWCLRCSWVSAGGWLEEAPVVLLDSVPCSTCWGVCGTMICCSGSEEMMITKRSGKSWGRRYRKEVGSPEEYIVSFKSKWHA